MNADSATNNRAGGQSAVIKPWLAAGLVVALAGNVLLSAVLIVKLGHFDDSKRQADEAEARAAAQRTELAKLQVEVETLSKQKDALAPVVADWQQRLKEKSAAEAVLATLDAKQRQSESDIAQAGKRLAALAAGGYRGTIGVVTPFRQQMIRLRDSLETGDSLAPDFMERVRFLAATAHGFQGDERDLILFSLCGGPEMTEGATIFLRENPNLFNVAVSRARAVLHVVGNRDWALDCGVPFIQKLARRTLPGATAHRTITRDPYQSPWEKVLADALTQAGVKVIPQYPIAGRFLDLAVVHPLKIDVKVDGESVHRTAGGGRKDDDHWRDLQLQSLGWKICRFWVYERREDLPRCVRRVAKLLED